MSFLLRKSQNYLTQINFENKEIELSDFLRSELFKRKLNKLLEINIKTTTKALKKMENIDVGFYLDYIKLSTDSLNFINVNKPRSNRVFIKNNIEKLTERGMYFAYLFITEILKEYDNLKTLNNSFEIDSKKNFIFQLFEKIDFLEVLKFIKSNTDNKIQLRIFETYYYYFNAFSKSDEEKNYFIYKKYLLKNFAHLNTDEIRFHFGRLIRYCIQKTSEKDSLKYERELFEVYKLILHKGFYKSELTNYLPVELYRTVLLLSLKLKKFKWVTKFIKTYISKLHPDRRKNMSYYSLTQYYFCREMYVKAMNSFDKVELNHFLFKVDLKNLMLMTYYQLNQFETALSLIDTDKHFLSKDNVLSTEKKKQNIKFSDTIHKMILYKTASGSVKKYSIEINLKKEMPYKDWLKKKFLELE